MIGYQESMRDSTNKKVKQVGEEEMDMFCCVSFIKKMGREVFEGKQ